MDLWRWLIEFDVTRGKIDGPIKEGVCVCVCSIFKRDQDWMSRQMKSATFIESHIPCSVSRPEPVVKFRIYQLKEKLRSICGHRQQENIVVADFIFLRSGSMSSENYRLILIYPIHSSFHLINVNMVYLFPSFNIWLFKVVLLYTTYTASCCFLCNLTISSL